VHRGVVGIWTERLTGEALSARLERVGTLAKSDVVRIGVDIASALVAVHAAGLVHGDVKEANVVIEDDGRVVLVDFGSGRTVGEPDTIEPLSSTPRYAAPEVLLDGMSPGVASDLYAFGVLLHRAAFGAYPVDGEDLPGLMEQHRLLRSRGGAAGVKSRTEVGGLEALVRRMTAPNAEERPPSAKVVLRELRFLLERSTVPASVVAMPKPTNRFFGRMRELAEIAAALQTERAVTVVGPGGSGKSRLVLEAVGPVYSNYSDGVVWVRLARLRSEGELVPAILQAAGMTAGADADRETLVRRLASRQMLLVLDNAEHLATPVRKLVDEVLSGTAGVTILTTSRRTLGGTYEKLIRLEPLPTEGEDGGAIAPAIALFADRAGRRDSDFDLTRSRPAVERICRRLEGIPLAIELAAARAAAVSPEEIANQLDLPLDLGADPGGTSRHSSLRASIAWSHDLLPEEARETFRDLSVFGGGWDSEAAIAVIDLPDFLVRESLATLVEHSLIRRDRGVYAAARYSMLETVREFGEARLHASTDADEVSARHAAYYRNLFLGEAPAIVSYDHPRALSRLSAEATNLERSLAWSLVAGASNYRVAEDHAALVLGTIPFWHLSGQDSVALRHLNDSLDRLGVNVGAITLGRLHLARGRYVYQRGFAVVESDLARAAELFRDVAPTWYALTLVAQGAVDTARLRFAGAESRILGALEMLALLGDESAMSSAWSRLADLRYKQARMEETAAAASEAEPYARESGDPVLLSMLLLMRASLAWASRDLETAKSTLEECLDVTAHAPFLPARAGCYSNLGTLYWEMGQPDEARRHWEFSESLSRSRGEDVRRATDLMNLADFYPVEERGRILREAFETFVRFDHTRNMVLSLAELGAHYIDVGRPELGVPLLAVVSASTADGTVTFPAPAASDLDASVIRARERVPEEEFARYWQVGLGLRLEGAQSLVRGLPSQTG
ncbi:MAG: protein kinase, partial [Candidatus Eisenbacteria bacterium]|nr:protein kinase [Candidatus Eisenbacteria bacterium]